MADQRFLVQRFKLFTIHPELKSAPPPLVIMNNHYMRRKIMLESANAQPVRSIGLFAITSSLAPVIIDSYLFMCLRIVSGFRLLLMSCLAICCEYQTSDIPRRCRLSSL